MTSAYILIAAILVLGGLISALGDRLGSKVGKARLRLFNLRPRQTAVVVTVLTGTMIAASTLGILFSLSESLRKGIFELDEILKKRRKVKSELLRVTEEKNQVEQELLKAKTQESEAKIRLAQIDENFQVAQARLKTVSNQVNALRSDVSSLLNERQELVKQRDQLEEQITQLQQKTNELQEQLQKRDQELAQRDRKLAQRDQDLAKRDQQIAAQDKILEEKENRLRKLEQQQSVLQLQITRRDEAIKNLDQAIATKDLDLKTREIRLKNLEEQLVFLKDQVEVLEQYYQTYQELRARRIALVRDQVLAFGAVRIVDPDAVTQAIDQLLSQANRRAIEATSIGNADPNKRVVQITKVEVEQLTNQIQDGRDYVVRILSAGNYVQGEEVVGVFADVVLNQKIFKKGEAIAAVSIDSETMSEEQIQRRLDLLIAASRFRARSAGILGEIQVEDGRITTLINFIDQLHSSEKPLEEIKTVASETTSTAGSPKTAFGSCRREEMMILGFDPGRDKCGVALMGEDRQVVYHQVVISEEAIATIERLSQQFPLELIVMGDQTTAKSWKQKIEANLAASIPIVMVDERNSSLEARDRYWQMYSPKGFARLIPQGMRLPPRPIDDLVAILLIERYLQGIEDWGLGGA